MSLGDDNSACCRTPNRHLAFGLGPHRSHLARLMSEAMVRAVLGRVPDRRVDVDQYLGNPSMTGLGRLPVTFTSGVKHGEMPGAKPPSHIGVA